MAGLLLAQNPTATLVGTVRDTSGAIVAGATLEVRNTDTDNIRKATSDENGDFTIPNLVPGPYEVTITKAGFRSVRETSIVLQMDQIARMPFQLEVGAVSQSVEVTAVAAPLIDTDNGSKGQVMTAGEIIEMPLNGRSISDLAVLVPGVTPNTTNIQGSAFAVNGARPDNTNFVIEGFAVTEQLGGGPLITPNLDAVQEFKMQTNSFSAENGRLAGGVMSTVLKTGGNQLHGALFEFVRNNAFDARNFFDQNTSELRRNQFGGVLSGPVVVPKIYNGHDRSFFLFSWESYRQVQGSATLGVVPTLAQRAGNFSQTGPIADPLLATGHMSWFWRHRRLFSRRHRSHIASQPTSARRAGFLSAAQSGRRQQYGRLHSCPQQLEFDDSEVRPADLFERHALVSLHAHGVQLFYNPGINPVAANANNTGLFGQLENDGLVGAGGSDPYTHLFRPTLINEVPVSDTLVNPASPTELPRPDDYNARFGIPGLTTNPVLIGFPEIYPSGYQQLGPGNNYPFRRVRSIPGPPEAIRLPG